jgi:cation-transporting ATPase 13A3/4/5
MGGKRIEKREIEEMMKIGREESESELEFLGFLIMQNKLKKESKDTIDVLN